MATRIWTNPVSGNWNDPTKWIGGLAPATNDSIIIGDINQVAAFSVTENATVTVTSLTMAGNHKSNQNTTLTLTQPAVLTVSGPISFDGDSVINGAGTLVANGSITGAGTLIASNGGTLTVAGTGSIASGVVLDFDVSTTAASTLRLDLAGGVTQALNVRMNNALQVLEIGPTTSLTINAIETFSKGTVRLLGGTINDALGIVVGGQGAPGQIIGFGTITANLTGGGQKAQVDTVTASGGTLVLGGGFAAGTATFVAAIDTVAGSTLKFDGTAVVGQPILINNAAQTLEIGSAASLTMSGLDLVTNGTIVMDGGTLSDTAGIIIDTAATLTGRGLVSAGTALTGDGAIRASGGVLELANDLTAAAFGTGFGVDTVAGSVLKVDGAVASAVTIGFLGASGVLELADVVGGALQGFSGHVAGLNVGASASVATNRINIQAAASSAVLSGTTLTVFNGATTVATLSLAAPAAAGAYALVQADAVLGGTDIYLSNQPPVAPGAPVLTAANDSGVKGDGITNVAAAVFTGTGIAGDVVTLLDGAASIGTATVGAGGIWSVTAASLAEGLNVLTATQSDAFGNASAASTALNVTLDTTAPVLTAGLVSDTGASAADGITSNAALHGTADAGRTVTISNGATVLGSTTAGAGGAWSFTPVGLVDGSYSLTAAETDAATRCRRRRLRSYWSGRPRFQGRRWRMLRSACSMVRCRSPARQWRAAFGRCPWR